MLQLLLCVFLNHPVMPKHQGGLIDQITNAEQSPLNSCNLNSVTFNSEDDLGAAEEMPTRRTSSGVNLRWVLLVGPWNIPTLLEAQRLTHKLSRLRMDIVRLSETRRPGSGEISNRGFIYY